MQATGLTGEKTCSRCGKAKPLDQFYANSRSKDGKRPECMGCSSANNRSDSAKAVQARYRDEHREERVEQSRQRYHSRPEEYASRFQRYYRGNQDRLLANAAQYREANREKVRAGVRRSYRKHQGKNLAASKAKSAELRVKVFEHYGLACACCDSSEYLTVDHVNGDGAEHRQTLPKGALALYRWLIKHGFPEGFQTLCRSCNSSKGRGPACQLDHSEGGLVGPTRQEQATLIRRCADGEYVDLLYADLVEHGEVELPADTLQQLLDKELARGVG